jgi:hypothetical protein
MIAVRPPTPRRLERVAEPFRAVKRAYPADMPFGSLALSAADV